MKTAIFQHYVPQFILRNFKSKPTMSKKNAKFFVFDKSNDRIFQAQISSTGGERYFYEVRSEGDEYSIEEKLGIYESLTAPIFKKIIDNGSLKSLTRKEKAILSKFIALQYLRGPAIRNRLRDLSELLETKLNFFEESGFPKPSEDESKRHHCEIVLDSVNKLSPYLYNKDWVLCESKTPSFLIGDNPVVMHNTFDNGTGFKDEGVEVYLPISPHFSLLILCGSVRKKIVNSLEIKTLNPSAQPHIKNLQKYAHTFKRKGTMLMNSENIKFSNSLQVINSERFLYSHESKFDLVNQMISDNEAFRTGSGRYDIALV